MWQPQEEYFVAKAWIAAGTSMRLSLADFMPSCKRANAASEGFCWRDTARVKAFDAKQWSKLPMHLRYCDSDNVITL